MSATLAAAIAALPANALADPAKKTGAEALILAQVPSEETESAGQAATAGEQDAPAAPPADGTAQAESGETGPAESAQSAAPPAPAAPAPASPAAGATTGQAPAEAAGLPEAQAAEETAPAAAPATAGKPPAREGLPGHPPILRSTGDMPEPVRKTWTALRDAARSGDIEALQPLIDAQPSPPTFAFADIDDPIRYLKSLSGDPEGHEILAILLEVLESGFVLADAKTQEEMYLWPYFARYPLEELSPRQMVEMFTLLTAGDYQDMLSYGAYIFFRVGISPDGAWRFFVAGD